VVPAEGEECLVSAGEGRSAPRPDGVSPPGACPSDARQRNAGVSHDHPFVRRLRKDPSFATEDLKAALELEDEDEPRVLLIALRHRWRALRDDFRTLDIRNPKLLPSEWLREVVL